MDTSTGFRSDSQLLSGPCGRRIPAWHRTARLPLAAKLVAGAVIWKFPKPHSCFLAYRCRSHTAWSYCKGRIVSSLETRDSTCLNKPKPETKLRATSHGSFSKQWAVLEAVHHFGNMWANSDLEKYLEDIPRGLCSHQILCCAVAMSHLGNSAAWY